MLKSEIYIYIIFKCFTSIILIQITIEIIADSHAIVRNDSERTCVYFTQFPLAVTLCKTIVQQHNPGIDTGTIHQSYSELLKILVLLALILVHVCVYSKF